MLNNLPFVVSEQNCSHLNVLTWGMRPTHVAKRPEICVFYLNVPVSDGYFKQAHFGEDVLYNFEAHILM